MGWGSTNEMGEAKSSLHCGGVWVGVEVPSKVPSTCKEEARLREGGVEHVRGRSARGDTEGDPKGKQRRRGGMHRGNGKMQGTAVG